MKAIFNKTPFTNNAMANLPLGAIKPEGWLYEQLKLQAVSFTGAYSLPADGEWLKMDADSFETAASYLDGLVSLAYTLDNEQLKQKTIKYIEDIFATQRDDGWFGAADNTDYWPLMVCIRALFNYFTATLDKRVLVLMDKFFKYEYKNLDSIPLKGFACARGAENMLYVVKLYNITGQKYLLELLNKIKDQMLDWPTVFHTFPNIQPISKSFAWERLKNGMESPDEEGGLSGIDKPFFNKYYHQSHGVNIAMGLKAPGVISLIKSGFKEQGGFKFGWSKLTKYHGTANGMFTCDEHLDGTLPTKGCASTAVTETMASIEALIGLGDFGNELCDILEKLAYNALPAMFGADMKSYQRLQQTNQICAASGEHKWYNLDKNVNAFTENKQLDACAASIGNGWPQFASSLWYATNDDGLSVISYAPCRVKTVIDGVPVKLQVTGSYPFNESIDIEATVKAPVEFPMYLRIPFWAKSPVISLPDGEIMTVKSGETACIRRKWMSGDIVRLDLNMEPRITRWGHQLSAVEVGPLLMAYSPKSETSKKEIDKNITEYSVRAADKWNYAIINDEAAKLVFTKTEMHTFKNGETPVKVLAKFAEVDWDRDGDDCAVPPVLPKAKGEAEVLELIPYGFTSIRISEFPGADMDKKRV